MNKAILTLFVVSMVTITWAQTTRYNDRADWQAAATNICHTEDFNSFTTDTEFRTAPLQLDGFTLHRDMGIFDFLNYIDVSPFVSFPSLISNVDGTPYAAIGVSLSDPSEVVLTFDNPVYGFYADYALEASGSVLTQVYNGSGGMIDSYTFTMDNTSTGIISTEPMSSIRFVATNSTPIEREWFGLDNIEINCDPPAGVAAIPTLSQWGIIVLFMIMLIFGLVMIRQGKRVFA